MTDWLVLLPDRAVRARREPTATADELIAQYPGAQVVRLPNDSEAAEERIAIVLEGEGRL